MSSGRQVADENVEKFAAWCASKTDEDYRTLASRGVISRTEISAECGFAKSVLIQNPRVKHALKDLEDSLRLRGVLPEAIRAASSASAELPLRSRGGMRAALDAERLKRLELELASSKAEVAELKRRLERYAVLQDVLADMGRVPR